MNEFALQQPWALLALAFAPALAILFYRARRKRAALLRAYGGQRSAEMLARSRERRRAEWCVVAAMVLLALALARPCANPHPGSSPEGGRDVIFVLDVSRSMLGEDIRPSRLERAKLDIARCMDSLGNDRVGLVAFAGAAAIRCPLTTDYEFFRQMLKDTTPDSVPRGSTYLELGLEKTTDRMLVTNRSGFQDVILLTDGGDQGSHPERTIASLNRAGARLLVVGYGDPKIGTRVPLGEGDTNGFLVYEGQEVWTKLDEASLESLAGAATHGKHVHGGTADFDLGRTYQAWSANAPRQFLHGVSDLKYDEYFGWLLVPALALLLYPFTPLRQRTTLLLLAFMAIGQLHAADASNGRDQTTAPATTAAKVASPGEPPFQFGVSLMRKKSFEDAAKAFATAADGATAAEATAICRYDEALADAALADSSRDPGAQLESLHAAIAAMRSVRLLRPHWLAAAQGLEVLYDRRTNAGKALKAQQDAQDQLNQQAADLQKELERLLAEQKKLLAAGTHLQYDHITPPAQKVATFKMLHDRQEEIGQQTETLRGKMAALRDTLRGMISQMSAVITPVTPAGKVDNIPTDLDKPLEHVAQAHKAQNQAVQLLAKPGQIREAVQAKQQAVNELEAALITMAASQSGSFSDEEDNGDGSGMTDSADSDNAASQSTPMKGDFISDLVNRSLPKPNFTSEDILKEEQANAQTRTKNQPARVGKGEKDW